MIYRLDATVYISIINIINHIDKIQHELHPCHGTRTNGLFWYWRKFRFYSMLSKTNLLIYKFVNTKCTNSPYRKSNYLKKIIVRLSDWTLKSTLSVSYKIIYLFSFYLFSLQASQDEAKASKEVIGVLRKQVQTLQREKETLSAMKPELSEGQLIDILRLVKKLG